MEVAKKDFRPFKTYLGVNRCPLCLQRVPLAKQHKCSVPKACNRVMYLCPVGCGLLLLTPRSARHHAKTCPRLKRLDFYLQRDPFSQLLRCPDCGDEGFNDQNMFHHMRPDTCRSRSSKGSHLPLESVNRRRCSNCQTLFFIKAFFLYVLFCSEPLLRAAPWIFLIGSTNDGYLPDRTLGTYQSFCKAWHLNINGSFPFDNKEEATLAATTLTRGFASPPFPARIITISLAINSLIAMSPNLATGTLAIAVEKWNTYVIPPLLL